MDATQGQSFDAVVERATTTLRRRLQGRPIDWALVCGSGFGKGLMQGDGGLGLVVEETIALAELGMPTPGVAGHGKALVIGTIGARRVVVQTGRIHPYEGHSVQVCTAALAAALTCGARGVALTCAAGGLSPVLVPGDVVLIKDQIGLFGPTPLVGPRFIGCGALYEPRLRARAQAIAAAAGLEALREAVYVHCRGPQYETPAETEALRRLGGDIVGMSTTYEALLAVAEGAAVAGVAVVTNVAGIVGLSHAEVEERSDAARPRVARLLAALLAEDPSAS
jgi:purine-nucleoside phosphorylase